SMVDDGRTCRVIVPDSQLSLAIGKEGKNARLASKLTGCKIDIKPASQMMDSSRINIDLSMLDLDEGESSSEPADAEEEA
ncbi:MAG: transcription termination/antitermination protein NusA, partial [Oscillospiraceae bacterium]|nr:transcription termination/antitermination protein NusA [Oscillospiraceae bacterium]